MEVAEIYLTNPRLQKLKGVVELINNFIKSKKNNIKRKIIYYDEINNVQCTKLYIADMKKEDISNLVDYLYFLSKEEIIQDYAIYNY